MVYVFDLTEPYPIQDQLTLFEEAKKLGKEIIVYFSKSDIMDVKKITSFKIKGTYSPDEVKQIILVKYEKSEKKALEEKRGEGKDPRGHGFKDSSVFFHLNPHTLKSLNPVNYISRYEWA